VSRAIGPDGLPPGYQLKPGLEISPREASEKLRRDEVTLIDCRTAPEWEIARVEPAIHVPLGEIEARAEDIREEAERRGKPVAVICHHGVRSLKAALALRALGVPGAVSVAGGIEAWSQAIDPSVPRYERSGDACRRV